ncbi:uncharacterized protein LOC121467886 [Drosophila elegans]|uniref:uncharacterized protein LOC121467886 n=1 Tax=Drosophila elegans TaxID=30023 RepID=UPI001BC852A4|nr:uncharacterized protein LOC121467886 [Drosophila elegans]
MGKQMCPIKPGVLHGCISIFLKVRNTAGGREGFMKHEDNVILITTEEPVEQTLSPLLRCLSCKFCAPYEGKSLNEKGKKWCPLQLGVLNGCISIYYNFSSNAGGPEGYINRSCFSDLNESDLEYCKKNEKVCHKCYTADCNNIDITSNGFETDGGEGARMMVSKFLMIASSIGCLLISV